MNTILILGTLKAHFCYRLLTIPKQTIPYIEQGKLFHTQDSYLIVFTILVHIIVGLACLGGSACTF